MIKNDLELMSLAKKYNFKVSKNSIFGLIQNVPVQIDRNGARKEFNFTILINGLDSKLVQSLVAKFKSSEKFKFKIEVDKDHIFLMNVALGIKSLTIQEKADVIVQWWSREITGITDRERKLSDIVLYDGLIFERGLKEYAEANFDKLRSEKPVDNVKGILYALPTSVLAVVFLGMILGFLRVNFKFGIPPFIDILLVFRIVGDLYKRFANDLDEKSRYFFIPLFFLCSIWSQVTKIFFALYFDPESSASVAKAIDIFLKQFVEGNKYSQVMLMTLVFMVIAFFSLKTRSESFVEDEGEDFDHSFLIEANSHKEDTKFFVILFFLGLFSLLLGSMLNVFYNIESFEITNRFVLIGTWIIFFVLSFVGIMMIYNKRYSREVFTGSKIENLVGAFCLSFFSLIYSSALMALFNVLIRALK